MSTTAATFDPVACPEAVDRFPVLERLPGIDALMTTRLLTPGEKSRHTERIDLLTRLLPAAKHFRRCVQIHSNRCVLVRGHGQPVQDCDALITDQPGTALLISAADCCPVFVVDHQRRVVGLAHSGRKGSELGIAKAMVEQMKHELGCQPENMIAQLGPCARPPDYETDFVAWIKHALLSAGLNEGNIHDCKINTIPNVHRYYSHRAEHGQTGRMAAAIVMS